MKSEQEIREMYESKDYDTIHDHISRGDNAMMRAIELTLEWALEVDNDN